VKLTINLWNSNNNLIGSESGFALHNILQVKATSCIRITWLEDPRLAKITLDSITFSPTTDRLPSMRLSNASLTPYGDFYRALGIIKNNEVTLTALSVRSVNLIYNSSKIISCSYTWVGARDLMPGASSSFSDSEISLPPGYSPTSYSFIPNASGVSISTNAEPDFAPTVIDYYDEVVDPFQ
jgi:hypothetical protein